MNENVYLNAVDATKTNSKQKGFWSSAKNCEIIS